MRVPPLPAVVVVSVATTAVVATATVLLGGGGGQEPDPPAATGVAAPATTEPRPPPEVEPFAVELVAPDGLHVITLDNATILPREAAPVDDAAAAEAAEIGRAAFERFLNAQFTDRATWFGDAPIDALLTPAARAALDAEDRAALGSVDLAVEHVLTGEATVEPMVAMQGGHPRQVTLEFRAAFTATTPTGPAPVRLSGTLVLVPTAEGWLAAAVDATLVMDGAA